LARAGGFTLLEVIIALAILGIGLGVILPGIGLSLRMRRDASDDSRLALAAEQVLGDLVQRTKPLESVEEGEIDGCRWQLEPLETSAARLGEARPHGAALTTVRLTLTAPGGPHWEMTTLLPGPKPESNP
jgi:prepilin-type N-terminal cleavage/methylation domain-containing protein